MAVLFYVGLRSLTNLKLALFYPITGTLSYRAVAEVDFRGFEDNFSNFSMETYVVIPH